MIGELDNGAWSPRQALAFSQRMLPDERVNVLIAVTRLAPDLTDEVLADAANLGQSPMRLRLLAAIGQQDLTRKTHLATVALAMFPAACPRLFTADAVTAILPLLEQSQLPQLVDLIESLGHPQGRATALLTLAETQAPQQRRRLVSSATRAAASLRDAETSCQLLLHAASLAADELQRADALAQAHARARTLGPADRRLSYLIDICLLSPSAARAAVQREALALIDSEQVIAVSANQHLCRLLQHADPVQLDELADWAAAATSPMWKHGGYASLTCSEFLWQLTKRLDRCPSARRIRTRALAHLQDRLSPSPSSDEESAAVHLLDQVPDGEFDQWQPLVDKLSELGHLERALIDDGRRAQLDFSEVEHTITRALRDNGAGVLTRVLRYADRIPAPHMVAPLAAATGAIQHQPAWHGLVEALPHLLDSVPRQGDKLDSHFSSAFTRLIAAMTGQSRFAAASLLAPELSREALQQLLDLQMRIDDISDQDQLLVTLTAEMDAVGRAHWAPKILTRLGLPEPGTELTEYLHTARELLPLLGAEDVMRFANAIAGDVAVTPHRGRVFCNVLYRLCELGHADTAVDLLARDAQQFLAEDLSIKVAERAAATEDTQLDSAVLALVGEGYSRLRRLLALPEQWRSQHRELIADELARWQSTNHLDFRGRYIVDLLSAATPYITDDATRAATVQLLLAAIAAFDRPEDRVESLVALLRSSDQPHLDAIVALTQKTFAQCAGTYPRRRLLTALAPHLSVPVHIELVLTEFACDYLFDPALTAMIDRLDAQQVRDIYAKAAGYAHTRGGADDTFKAHTVIMARCLIRLADLGSVDECLALLQQPPADTVRLAQVVVDAIAEHIPYESLPLATRLVSPQDGNTGRQITTAPLLLREAHFTGALKLYERLATPTPSPTYYSGNILPGLVERLLPLPTHLLYHPLADLLRQCSHKEHRRLLRDLADLTPMISLLGGSAALEATANAVVEVGEWFA
ncbi:hypothetical protein [Mycolicibacterium fortuitum]|uniref:hypothetical protein n=1 Tax=Mycolicibacterium fortuitum TaxID=1766 RepID=UPI0013F4D5DA|nr:hypothetical protein [Mycolicibacterium fortuitum]